MIVYVFVTDIHTGEAADAIRTVLQRVSGILKTTVDLEDVDKVLRVVSETEIPAKVIQKEVHSLGYSCREMGD
jgi:copper chaperone CopZ